MTNKLGIIPTYDGDFEIVYSNIFNIYEDKLIFENVFGFKIIFEFEEDSSKEGFPMELRSDDVKKELLIKSINFKKNSFGTGTKKKIPILKLSDGKELFFSIHVKSLNDSTRFLQISITLYLK